MEFIREHFETALESPNGIKKLRELILTLGMQGRLVPQDPREGTGAELLREIEIEKERMDSRIGKLQRGYRDLPGFQDINSREVAKPRRVGRELPEIKEAEIPYDVPESWLWVRLGEIGEMQTGTTPETKDSSNYGDYIPFIGPGDIQNQEINYNNNRLSEKGLKNSRLISKNSIMMVCIGGSIGKHAINLIDVACNQQINTIKPYLSDIKFTFYSMWADHFQKNLISKAGGSATPIINKNNWSIIPIPLPPLAEQKRIVAKIEELMKLCDTLEAQLERATLKRTALFDAVLARV